MTKRPPTAADLLLAVDALIEPTRVRVQRDDTGRVEYQKVPSVWEQLEGSAGWKGGTGGGGAYRTRPTIATGVVSLIIDISTAAAEGAIEHANINRHNVPGNLKAIAANLPNSTTDSRDDQIIWWTESVNKWTATAKTELHIEPDLPRNLRGTRCPDCGADTVLVGDPGEEKVRTSALTIVWSCPTGDDHKADADWTVRAIECRVCSAAWFRGDSMNTLMDQMLMANLTQETMTDGVA